MIQVIWSFCLIFEEFVAQLEFLLELFDVNFEPVIFFNYI